MPFIKDSSIKLRSSVTIITPGFNSGTINPNNTPLSSPAKPERREEKIKNLIHGLTVNEKRTDCILLYTICPFIYQHMVLRQASRYLLRKSCQSTAQHDKQPYQRVLHYLHKKRELIIISYKSDHVLSFPLNFAGNYQI